MNEDSEFQVLIGNDSDLLNEMVHQLEDNGVDVLSLSDDDWMELRTFTFDSDRSDLFWKVKPKYMLARVFAIPRWFPNEWL